MVILVLSTSLLVQIWLYASLRQYITWLDNSQIISLFFYVLLRIITYNLSLQDNIQHTEKIGQGTQQIYIHIPFVFVHLRNIQGQNEAQQQCPLIHYLCEVQDWESYKFLLNILNLNFPIRLKMKAIFYNIQLQSVHLRAYR